MIRQGYVSCSLASVILVLADVEEPSESFDPLYLGERHRSRYRFCVCGKNFDDLRQIWVTLECSEQSTHASLCVDNLVPHGLDVPSLGLSSSLSICIPNVVELVWNVGTLLPNEERIH